jgi:hypothetical protein
VAAVAHSGHRATIGGIAADRAELDDQHVGATHAEFTSRVSGARTRATIASG